MQTVPLDVLKIIPSTYRCWQTLRQVCNYFKTSLPHNGFYDRKGYLFVHDNKIISCTDYMKLLVNMNDIDEHLEAGSQITEMLGGTPWTHIHKLNLIYTIGPSNIQIYDNDVLIFEISAHYLKSVYEAKCDTECDIQLCNLKMFIITGTLKNLLNYLYYHIPILFSQIKIFKPVSPKDFEE